MSSEHEAAVAAWRSRREAALRRPLGWLSLAGLAWLKPGPNRLGASPSSDIVLPAGPPLAGEMRLEGDRVITTAASNTLRHDGQPAEQVVMRSDGDVDDDEEPTLLELGELRMCIIRRGERHGLRVWDTNAPALRSFEGIPHFPVDRRWRLEAVLEPGTARTIAVPDVLGDVEDEESLGTIAFEVGGATYRLETLPGGPSGELWLIFADATNGIETYGGGRFLYTDAPDAAGRLFVDFNMAYNPPCVFSPYATCPLPWPANRLPIRIEAGELMYRAGTSHS